MESPVDSVDEILATIRRSGHRVTVAKQTVAEVLVSSDRHLNVDEITAQVQHHHPDVSTSTIYRILEEFEELKIVVHAHLGQSAAVYHLSGTVHAHLTCEICNATLDVLASHFDALSRDLLTTYGFVLDRHHVALSGVCARCLALGNQEV